MYLAPAVTQARYGFSVPQLAGHLNYHAGPGVVLKEYAAVFLGCQAKPQRLPQDVYHAVTYQPCMAQAANVQDVFGKYLPVPGLPVRQLHVSH